MKALNCVNFCYAELLRVCYVLLQVKAENCFTEDISEVEPWGRETDDKF